MLWTENVKKGKKIEQMADFCGKQRSGLFSPPCKDGGSRQLKRHFVRM